MDNFEATILSQFANSLSIRQLLKNMNDYLDPSARLENFFEMVWNVDTAQGNGLDIWGRIVGVERVLQVAGSVYFGFKGPVSQSGNPFNWGIFYSGQNINNNFSLLDAPYRVLILAKALFNITDCSIPAINQILINVFGPQGLLPLPGNSYCTDGLDMTMTYTFAAQLSPVQAAIVFQSSVLPRPAGVLASVVQL